MPRKRTIMVVPSPEREKPQARAVRLAMEKGSLPALALMEAEAKVHYESHSHPYHQLMCPLVGSTQLEVGSRRYLLPPHCAAWISAGVVHRTTLGGSTMASVWFHPRSIRWPAHSVRIIAAPPLLRAMAIQATQWPIEAPPNDPLPSSFYRTFALLCKEWIRHELPFWLPNSQHTQVSRGIEYTLQHLATATIPEAAAASAMSERSFRRHFEAEMNMSWREYLQKARLLRAMELLGQPDARVSEVAAAVGFQSASAFGKQFAKFTQTTPKDFRNAAKVDLGKDF